jgi:hypothetical protein
MRRRTVAALLGLVAVVLSAVPALGALPDNQPPDTMASAAPPTQQRRGGAVLETDPATGLIYLAGGAQLGNDLATLEVYDAEVDAWTTLTPAPATRFVSSGVFWRGELWVIGGRAGGVVSDTTAVYNPATDTWRAGPTLPFPSYGGSAEVVGDKLFIVGSNMDFAPSGAGIMCDGTTTITCTEWGNRMPTPRWSTGTSVIDGKIYVVGGYSSLGTPSKLVEVFDPATGSWLPGPFSSAPAPIISAAAVGGDGRLYTLPAQTGGVPSGVLAYDATGDVWSVGTTSFARNDNAGAAVMPTGDIMFGFGFQFQAPLRYRIPGQTVAQNVTVDVVQGTLSISLSQSTVAFGTVGGGFTNTAPVGTISYHNTLNNGSPWSATVAATALTYGSHAIPYTAMSFTPGGDASITPTGPLTAGTGGSFADQPTPGMFSAPITLMTAPGSAQGDFAHADSVLGLTVPPTASSGTYRGTLQYTILG